MANVERVTRESMRPLIEPYGLAEAAIAGGLIHLAGQTGMDASHQIVAGGLRAQAEQAFANLREVLELAGGRSAGIVSLTWYLAEGPESRTMLEDAFEVTAARESVFPGLRCGQTAVRVKALLTPEILIEITGVAALP